MKDCVKRFLAALAACLLVLGCLMAGLATETGDGASIPENLGESDIVGVWRLTTLEIEGTRMSSEMIGIEIRYEFRDDHTARGTFVGMLGDNGQAEETWTLDADQGLILVDGSPFLKVRCEDGEVFLLMDEEVSVEASGTLVFTRYEDPEADG